MFDLSSLDVQSAANTGAVLQLRHPASGIALKDDDGNPITIRLAGADSDAYRKAQRAITNRRLAETKRRGGIKLTAEELEDEALDLLAGATLDWTGIVFAGEELPFSTTNARKLYQALPWIREQVDEFVQERANFLTA